MDDAKKQLVQDAAQMAGEFERHSAGLKNEQLAAKIKALEVEASLQSSNLAARRLETFKVMIEEQLQCPRCWIAHEINSPLVPRTSENEAHQLVCGVCQYQLSC